MSAWQTKFRTAIGWSLQLGCGTAAGRLRNAAQPCAGRRPQRAGRATAARGAARLRRPGAGHRLPDAPPKLPPGSRKRGQARLLHGQARRHDDPHRPGDRPELERPGASGTTSTTRTSIEVGQVLRVVPPGSMRPPRPRADRAGQVETRPLDAKPAARRRPARPATPRRRLRRRGRCRRRPHRRRRRTRRLTTTSTGRGRPRAGDRRLRRRQDQGPGVAGKAGDPVLAAADGRVVYAGSGLRGYGNLVILKHNNTYLTAYAHNQTLLVKEDQTVQARPEDRRDGLDRRRPGAAALRDPPAGQADRSGQAAAAALSAPAVRAPMTRKRATLDGLRLTTQVVAQRARAAGSSVAPLPTTACPARWVAGPNRRDADAAQPATRVAATTSALASPRSATPCRPICARSAVRRC